MGTQLVRGGGRALQGPFQGGSCLGACSNVTVGNAACVRPRALTLPDVPWESEVREHTVPRPPPPLIRVQPPVREARGQGLLGFGLPARQPLGGALEP